MCRKVRRLFALAGAVATLWVVYTSVLSSRASESAPHEVSADLIANLHSDFAMFRGDLTGGVNLIGASVVSDDYPGGPITGRIAFWWFDWPADARQSVLSRALAQIDWINNSRPHVAA